MPAVTTVLLCTRAVTVVGADIAAGSQAEKGICALLLERAKKKKQRKKTPPPFCLPRGREINPLEKNKMLPNKAASPRRLNNSVIVPPERAAPEK